MQGGGVQMYYGSQVATGSALRISAPAATGASAAAAADSTRDGMASHICISLKGRLRNGAQIQRNPLAAGS